LASLWQLRHFASKMAFPSNFLELTSAPVAFGSDSPWTDQKEMVDRTLRLGLPERALEKLMGVNARRLLGINAS